MIELLLLLLLNSLVCLGFYHACQYDPGHTGSFSGEVFKEETKGLLWFIPKYLDRFPSWVRKPIYECLPCMASIHSYVYWMFQDDIWIYPIYILALSGLNILILSIYESE